MPVRVFEQQLAHGLGLVFRRPGNFHRHSFDPLVKFVHVIDIDSQPGTFMPLVALTKKDGRITMDHTAESRRIIP